MSIRTEFASCCAIIALVAAVAISRPCAAQAIDAHPKAVAQEAAVEAEAAEHESGDPNPLAFSTDLAIWTLVVFIVLFLVLKKFAWPQITEALEERERGIAATIAAADARLEDAKRVLADHEAKLAATAGEVRELLEEARRDADHTRKSIEADGHKAAKEELDRALREIERARDAAAKDLAVASANTAIELARNVIKVNLTPEQNNQLIREAVAKLQPSNNEAPMPQPERVSPKHETVMDVTVEQLARVYALAFLGVIAKSPNADDLMLELSSVVSDILDQFPQLEKTLESSLVSADQKEQLIDRIFGKAASPHVLNFLKVVSRHGRLELLRTIARQAAKLHQERSGMMDVEIRVAAELADDVLEHIRARIQKAINMQPVINVKIDESLVGGIVVRVGDRLFDGSLRTQLEHVRHAMIDRATDMIETQPDRFLSAL